MRDLLLIAAASLITVWDVAINQMQILRTIAYGLAGIGHTMLGFTI